MKYVCDNCQEEFSKEEEFRPLGLCAGLEERLDPGSIVPDGECPDCGAFVYIEDGGVE